MPDSLTGWHLDKRIPLAILFALLIQTSGIVWWAASISERVSTVEQWIEKRPPSLEPRIVTLESDQRNLISMLSRIETILDRLEDRLRAEENKR